MASEERFGYEWDTYSALDAQYEGQFLNWTKPLAKEDWEGKDVLDGGCGMGRNSYWPLRYGARSVVAFDNDDRSVAAARATLAPFKNAEVVKRDFSDIDWREQFDIAFSIGVIHHLRRPELALKNLVMALRPGGKLVVWVYSREGNEWIVRYVNPIRLHITSKLPLPLVHFISYVCSIPLYLFVRLFRGPTPYLKQLSQFKFWHVHSIVFDQLIPAVANYWSREEVESLARALALSSFDVHAPDNKMGWILCGTK